MSRVDARLIMEGRLDRCGLQVAVLVYGTHNLIMMSQDAFRIRFRRLFGSPFVQYLHYM